jgi:hypothetical protein
VRTRLVIDTAVIPTMAFWLLFFLFLDDIGVKEKSTTRR